MDHQILNEITNILCESGYTVDIESPDEELFFDSIQFISALVCMENEFNISIPEQYLSGEGLNTLRDYYSMIVSIISH